VRPLVSDQVLWKGRKSASCGDVRDCSQLRDWGQQCEPERVGRLL